MSLSLARLPMCDQEVWKLDRGTDMSFTAHKEKDNKMANYIYGWKVRKVGMTLKV